MLATERRQFLLNRLTRDGRIVAKEVAAELGLTDDSIRKDLRELAADGLLQRVYGGAVPASPALADYPTRRGISTDSKRRVAAAAAGLIEQGSTVLVDGGSTTLALIGAIPHTVSATIITHSPTIAVAAAEHPKLDVIILGGRLYKHSVVAMGAALVEAASQIRADQFFLGVTGVHADEGLTTGDLEEAAVKRMLSTRAHETIVLASSEKIGTASAHRVIDLAQATTIITDVEAGNPTVAALRRRGLSVTLA